MSKHVELEDHHPEYIMKILGNRWSELDERRRGKIENEGIAGGKGTEYSIILAEQQRIETINERMRNAE